MGYIYNSGTDLIGFLMQVYDYDLMYQVQKSIGERKYTSFVTVNKSTSVFPSKLIICKNESEES